MVFRFKNFSLEHDQSALKIGTDAVLLAALVDMDVPQRILDVGAGCGVITYVLADRLKNSSYMQTFRGLEIDFPSFQESNKNRALYNAPPHQDISFINTSLQEYHAPELYDLIVSNPPYFHDDLKPTDSRRWASKHQDGLLSFEDLAYHVKRLLEKSGTFWIILPATEYIQFKAIAAILGLFSFKEIHIHPTPKKSVNRIVGAFKTAPSQWVYSEMTLRNENGLYSDEYRRLVEDILLQIKKPSP